ncbi:MAG: CHAD domain-containing protein, partial [Cyanobacteria bacterium P01_G01_bin.49]
MTHQLEHEPTTFGDWGYLAIAKHSSKFIKHESGVLEDKDPEELHQMRVGMRRLRSAIHGFDAALELPKNAQEKKVKKIAQVLGKLRDLDVLQDTFKNQ